MRAVGEARTWYAMSKSGKCALCMNARDIARHWSAVGSTPVGLCAHACSRNTLPSGAACGVGGGMEGMGREEREVQAGVTG